MQWRAAAIGANVDMVDTVLAVIRMKMCVIESLQEVGKAQETKKQKTRDSKRSKPCYVPMKETIVYAA